MPARLLVLGTHNRGKVRDLSELLAPLAIEVRSLAEFPQPLVVDETGDSFAANAALKASLQARHLGHWVLGEDSGIVVDALDGRPGIFSARYAGDGATDAANNRRLLAELGDTPPPQRTAHYVCQLALSDPGGTVRLTAGARCFGRIRREPAGTAGFGYDPLFEVVEYHRTFGELGEQVRQVLSHRAKAVGRLLPELVALEGLGLPAACEVK
jgi:XTP/dITP diphosphohydrolase